MLSLFQLCKQYPSAAFTLGPIDLDVQEGETICLLGHNGSGKSTFFSLISGQAYPSSGKAAFRQQLIHPENPGSKAQIGYLPQDLGFPPWATGEELLHYLCTLRGVPKESLAQEVRMWECESFLKKPIRSLSYGMEKRIGLTAALFHDPDLVILDEPFSGLDFLHIEALKEQIRKRKTKGQITILSTHVLEYAVDLADRCLILDQGTMTEVSPWTKDLQLLRKVLLR